MSGTPPTRRRWAEPAGVLAALVLSRSAYRAAGVVFDAGPLANYWQVVDPELLRDDLWRSVAHLRAQPPLFNLFLAAGLRLPEAWRAPAFALVYLGLGWALGWALLALQRRLGVPAALGWTSTLAFVVAPATALFESQLFYAYPAAAGLALSALFLHRFASEGRTGDGVVFFALVVALSLLWTVFHPAWVVAVVAAAAAASPRRRIRVAKAAAAPLFVLLLWLTRAVWLPGWQGGATWLGMQAAQFLTYSLSDPELRALAGEAPEAAILEVRPFSPLARYAGRVRLPPGTGVALLDRPTKANGAVNYHHLAYDEISRRYLRAAGWLLRRRPDLYRRALGDAVRVYFHPAADNPWLGENRERIAGAVRWTGLALGQLEPYRGRLGWRDVAWGVVAGWLFAVGWALAHLARAARRGRLAAPSTLTVAYLAGTVILLSAIACNLLVGENHRVRFALDPLLLALLGAALVAVHRPGRPAAEGSGPS